MLTNDRTIPLAVFCTESLETIEETPDEEEYIAPGNTSGNTANGGIAAESDGWIYYRGNGNFLYRMKNDGSGNTKLTSDYASCINVVGDNVYYLASGDKYENDRRIVCIKADGTERKVLLDEDCTNLIAEGGWLYFLQNGRILRMKPDGSGIEQLPMEEKYFVQMFWVEDGKLVFNNMWDTEDEYGFIRYIYISCMNVDGSGFKILDTETYRNGRGDWAYNLQSRDGFVYYLFGGGGQYDIRKVPLKGGAVEEILSDEGCYSLNVQEDGFFCFTAGLTDEGSKLMHLNADGDVLMQLCTVDNYLEECYNLCVAGDWVFYQTQEGVSMTSSTEPQRSEYIIPDSDSRYITEADIEGFDAETARLARNEIYARYGYSFTDPELQGYFDGMGWYRADPNINSNNPPKLNSYEEQNVKVIKGYESWLANNQEQMPIHDMAALYDYPIISLGHWENDDVINGKYIFNEMIETDDGYIITCDILDYSDREEYDEPDVVDTRKLFIGKNVVVHCINALWATEYDLYEPKTFEEFLNEGSSYGIWPEFHADINGDNIVEIAERYTP